MLTKTKDEILISANGDYRYDSLTVVYSGDFESYFSNNENLLAGLGFG